MYESYTRQALPTEEYRTLLGTAIYVFLSNNMFMIENIIKTSTMDWYDLVDRESGQLKGIISKTISLKCGNKDIEELFLDTVRMRNRIIHGFAITSKDGEQILATKTRKNEGNIQYDITIEYLKEFIEKNGELSNLLHQYRGC